jgi:hypothetical protein
MTRLFACLAAGPDEYIVTEQSLREVASVRAGVPLGRRPQFER